MTEADIWHAVREGNIPLAILSLRAVQNLQARSAAHALAWACIVAACPKDGEKGLRYLEEKLRIGKNNTRQRGLRTVVMLGHAIREMDTYTIPIMVSRIRTHAPYTSRLALAELLLPIAEDRAPENIEHWWQSMSQLTTT